MSNLLTDSGANFSLCFLLIIAADFIGPGLLRKSLKLEYNPTIRWFFLHIIVNTATTVITFPDMIKTLIHPGDLLYFDSTSTHLPINLVLTLHLYHFFFFKVLSPQDLLHHFVMIGAMLISNLYGGSVSNYLVFYLNGFPGLIDYICLLMVKARKMNSLTQKRISTYINVWMRSPGIIYGCVIVWIYFNLGYFDYVHPLIIIFVIATSSWNGPYYCMRVTYNYGVKSRFSNSS